MSTSTLEHSIMEETGAPATAEEIQDEVATMGLDSKPDSEINGQSEVRLYLVERHKPTSLSQNKAAMAHRMRRLVQVLPSQPRKRLKRKLQQQGKQTL